MAVSNSMSIKSGDYSLEIVQKWYDRAADSFRNSTQAAEVKPFFEETILLQKGIHINQAICLATGSFSKHSSDGYPSVRDVAMTEFLAFEMWLELVRDHGHQVPKPMAFIQEPNFKAIDEEFSRYLGYTNINSADAEDYAGSIRRMTPETFLIIPCGYDYRNLITACLEVAHPL